MYWDSNFVKKKLPVKIKKNKNFKSRIHTLSKFKFNLKSSSVLVVIITLDHVRNRNSLSSVVVMFEQRTSKGSIEKWGQKIAYSAVTTSSTCPILGWRLIFIWSSQISEFFKVTLLSRNPLKNQFVQQIYCPYANFNLRSTVWTFKNEKNKT